MSIVVVTIPGPAKQTFISELQTATKGAVSLVVVQKRRPINFLKRFETWNRLPLLQKLSYAYYATRLRLQPSLQQRLSVFQATAAGEYDEANWAAPTYYTYDVNSDAVYAKLQAIQPTILAVWGSGLLAPRMVTLPQHALNLHFGISSAYRGAYANQRAVENNDWEAIGTTIHYMNGRADSGAVLASNRLLDIDTMHTRTLYDAFAAMHDTARVKYVDCVAALHQQQTVPTITPNLAASENLKLADWTPKRRVAVARALSGSWPR